MRPLHLIGPRVLVRRLEEPDQTRTGLFLPPSACERPQMGRVVAVGLYKPRWFGDPLTGLFLQDWLDVSLDDLVIFPKMHDLCVIIDGEELLELRHDELIAVIDE